MLLRGFIVLEITSWLYDLKSSGKAVIVEGESDAYALKLLGVRNVVSLSRKPLFSFVEEICSKHKEVVILTDLDREGRNLYRKLKCGFQMSGVRVDCKFREFLFSQTNVSQIEGIYNYVSRNFPRFFDQHVL